MPCQDGLIVPLGDPASQTGPFGVVQPAGLVGSEGRVMGVLRQLQDIAAQGQSALQRAAFCDSGRLGDYGLEYIQHASR